MKFLKFLSILSFSLIILTTITNTFKVINPNVSKLISVNQKGKRTKLKAKAKDDFAPSYFFKIYVDNEKVLECDFDAKAAEKPDEQHDKGIYLTNCKDYNENNVKLQSTFIKSGDDAFYLAYRTLAVPFSFVNPRNSNKFFKTVYKRSISNTLAVQFDFEYKSVGEIISDENAIKLKNWLNANRESKLADFKDLKEKINIAASKYFVNLAIYNKLFANPSAVEDQISEQLQQINVLKENLKSNQENIKTSSQRINELLIQLANEQVALNSMTSESSQIGTQLSFVSDLNKSLIAKDKTNPADYKTAFESDSTDYQKCNDKLKTEAPLAKELLINAFESLFTRKNLPECQKNLRDIYP